jgi:hypothetical protein
VTPRPATLSTFGAGPPLARLTAWRRTVAGVARRVASTDSLARWGWPGVLGALCLAAAAVLAFGVLPAQQREWADLSQRTAAATQQAARHEARMRAADAAIPPGHTLAATLPDAGTRQQRVAALLALAAEAGIAARSAEFKVVREPAAAHQQYTVTLPVSGPYAALRGFIEAALRADAALSLDRLQLRRASPAATAINAELVWSLHMRSEPAVPSMQPANGAQP